MTTEQRPPVNNGYYFGVPREVFACTNLTVYYNSFTLHILCLLLFFSSTEMHLIFLFSTLSVLWLSKLRAVFFAAQINKLSNINVKKSNEKVALRQIGPKWDASQCLESVTVNSSYKQVQSKVCYKDEDFSKEIELIANVDNLSYVSSLLSGLVMIHF